MVWLIIENGMKSNNKYLENTSLEQSKSLTCLNTANPFDRKMNFQGDVSFWLLLPEVFWLFISKLQVLFFELMNFSERSNTITNISCWTNFFSYPGTTLFHVTLREVKKKIIKIKSAWNQFTPSPLCHILWHTHIPKNMKYIMIIFLKNIILSIFCKWY